MRWCPELNIDPAVEGMRSRTLPTNVRPEPPFHAGDCGASKRLAQDRLPPCASGLAMVVLRFYVLPDWVLGMP